MNKNLLTFQNYFFEIYYRIFYIFITFFSLLIINYNYIYEFFYFFSKIFIQININKIDYNFITTDFTEILFSQIKLCFFITLINLIPIIWYHFERFFFPGLYLYEQIKIIKLKYYSLILLFFSLFITYIFIMPFLIKFFLSFKILINNNSINIELLPKINEFINFTIKLYFSIIFLFQIPLIIIIILKLNKNFKQFFINNRKFIYIIIFIIAALLSPPDIISQLFIALPFIIIYEFIIIYLYLNKYK